MEQGLAEKIEWIRQSLIFFVPEIFLSFGIILILFLSLFTKTSFKTQSSLAVLIFISSLLFIALNWVTVYKSPVRLFGGMIRSDDFSAFLRLLFDLAGLLTVLMTFRFKSQKYFSEYYVLLVAIVLGAHLLVMSMNFIMVFLSLEMISICSYVLAGFAFNKKGAEASLKYFLFGSVASAIMLYGLSILYGLTGTLDFSTSFFIDQLTSRVSPIVFIAILMTLAGFLYKIAAAPMHPWSPDIYEASPMPVVAFFSVVPKLAGIGILAKFLVAVGPTQFSYDWQLILSVVAIASITIGNFSALRQKSAKRMMAYSSIAQSGFLLVGIITTLPAGVHFMLFYSTVYTLSNFLVFLLLQYFESNGVYTIAGFGGQGKYLLWPTIFILTGLISLTGLPPTAGFTGKLFVFSSLWEAFSQSGKPILLWLLIFGLLNTVVSLFYYLRIPYYAFLKREESIAKQNNSRFENFLAFLLVVVILILFFMPGMLMGWINKINFVL